MSAPYTYVIPRTTAIRFRMDGIEPTAEIGTLLEAGSVLELAHLDLDRFVYFPLTIGGRVDVIRSEIRLDMKDSSLRRRYGR